MPSYTKYPLSNRRTPLYGKPRMRGPMQPATPHLRAPEVAPCTHCGYQRCACPPNEYACQYCGATVLLPRTACEACLQKRIDALGKRDVHVGGAAAKPEFKPGDYVRHMEYGVLRLGLWEPHLERWSAGPLGGGCGYFVRTSRLKPWTPKPGERVLYQRPWMSTWRVAEYLRGREGYGHDVISPEGEGVWLPYETTRFRPADDFGEEA